MRAGVLATLVALSSPAIADPADRLEASGFLGVEDFSKENGLGNALAPEQRPQTAPTFGGRLTYFALETSGDMHLDLGVEAELSFTPAWTGYGFKEARPSYFAPVFGYRANLLLRLGGGWFQPHVSGGVGALTVASDSPLMAKETDPVFVWGLGAQFAMGSGWQVRLDARQALTESVTGDTTSNLEALLSVGMRFGEKPPKPEPIEHIDVVVQKPPPPPEPDKDSDNDGIPDKLDGCPAQAESVNGIDDQDGCPEPDPDGDKIVGTADKCPDRAEDFDKFEDEDGCPEDDNDKDGIVDARDVCPNEPETKNGITDDDGCPDAVPPAVVEALATATKAKFDANSVRISSRIKTALDKALITMMSNAKLKYVITVHPDKDGDKDAVLANRRAENVKFYLVEQGVAMGALSTTVGPVSKDKNAPQLEITIAP
ncbi:MAG TPA: outer membrane beta-barrel protein [Kofleriaceae bacterium]|nr:outer membrane beta-barrel protein [Kofleriaceae bacterium]